MLLSISLILILGMFMGWICQKIKLPSLLGMLITGIVLGPYVLNLLDDSILGIFSQEQVLDWIYLGLKRLEDLLFLCVLCLRLLN